MYIQYICSYIDIYINNGSFCTSADFCFNEVISGLYQSTFIPSCPCQMHLIIRININSHSWTIAGDIRSELRVELT